MTLEKVLQKVMVALDEAEGNSLSANMTDYKTKIYECIDSCQRELAIFVNEILKREKITVIDGIRDLPLDCFEIKSLRDGNKRISYSKIPVNSITAPDGEYSLVYAAYPQKIDETTALAYNLEISPEASEALIYGVCAGLCINDEPELYSTYMDRYGGMCRSITERKEKYPKGEITGGVRL